MVNGERWAMDESQKSSCEDGRLCCLNDWQCESCLSARIRMPRFRIGEKINDIHNSWLPGFVILTTQKTLCIEVNQDTTIPTLSIIAVNIQYPRISFFRRMKGQSPAVGMALGICSPNERLTLIDWEPRLVWLVACGLANRTWTMAWKLGS